MLSYNSSTAAEEAFYAAFSATDLEAMMHIWADQPDIVCIHPNGPRLRGRDQVRLSWSMIFRDRVVRHFALTGLRIIGNGDQRIHLLEENISVPGTNYVSPPVLATNIYRRDQNGWHLIIHHASVAPSSLPTQTKGFSGPPPVATVH